MSEELKPTTVETSQAMPLVERLRSTPNWMRESFGSWKDCVLKYDRAPFEAADEIERIREHLGCTGSDGRDADPVEVIEMIRGWEADAQVRAELLEKHLRLVLEVARTWQPDYATKMDRDTLQFAEDCADRKAARSTPMAGAEPPKQGEAQEQFARGQLDGMLKERRLWVEARHADRNGAPLSDERIDHIADIVARGMPDGISGFCKSWGYRQFARALLEDCAGYYATPSPSVEPAPANSVPMPQNEDQAALMALIGENWLRENAPHRLRSPHQEPGWADSGNPLCNHDGQPACNGCLYMGGCMCAPKEPKP